MVVICLANRHLFLDDDKVVCDEKDIITPEQAKTIIPSRISELEKTIENLKQDLKKYENTFENEGIAREKFIEIQSKLQGINSSIDVMNAKLKRLTNNYNIANWFKFFSTKHKMEIEETKERLDALYKEREEVAREYEELKQIWYNLSYNKNAYKQISEQLHENIQVYKEYKALLKAIDDPKGVGKKYHEMVVQRNRLRSAEEDYENYYLIAENIVHFIDNLETAIDYFKGEKQHATLDPETTLLYPDMPWTDSFVKVLALLEESVRKRRKHLVESKNSLGEQLRVAKRNLLKVINIITSMRILKPQFPKEKLNLDYFEPETLSAVLTNSDAEISLLLINELAAEQVYRFILKNKLKQAQRVLFEYQIPKADDLMKEFLRLYEKATENIETERKKLEAIEKEVIQ